MKWKIKKIPFKKSVWFFVIALLICLLFSISIFLGVFFKILKIDWEDLRTINWNAISAVALIASALAVFSQALHTKELAKTAEIKPAVSVGIKSFSERILSKSKSFEEQLRNTRLIIDNHSDFTAFVWTKIDLKIDNKKANKYLKSSDFCSAKRCWEIDHSSKIHPFLLKDDILDKRETSIKDKIISVSISYTRSSIPRKPSSSEWIRLNTYSFRKKELQWLKNGIGIPYQFPYFI